MKYRVVLFFMLSLFVVKINIYPQDIESKLIKIQGGKFPLYELPSHKKFWNIVDSFFISSTEVTQDEFLTVMGYNNSWNKKSLYLPVDSVSFYECLIFCNKLSKINGFDPVYFINNTSDTEKWGELPDYRYNDVWDSVEAKWGNSGYRLPTQVEWVYSYLSGINNSYWFDLDFSGDKNVDLKGEPQSDYGWYSSNSNYSTHEVATKIPNSYGLYDLDGNVTEWVWDWDGELMIKKIPALNYRGPNGVHNRRILMGSFVLNNEKTIISHSENTASVAVEQPFIKGKFTGFRIVRK